MGAGKRVTKRRLKDYPPNVPKKLFRKLKEYQFNRSLTALAIGVNGGHLSKLLNQGIEPQDNSIRVKMFLPKLKVKRQQREKRDRPPEPEYMKVWKHLPTKVRHKAIQEFTTWWKRYGEKNET